MPDTKVRCAELYREVFDSYRPRRLRITPVTRAVSAEMPSPRSSVHLRDHLHEVPVLGRVPGASDQAGLGGRRRALGLRRPGHRASCSRCTPVAGIALWTTMTCREQEMARSCSACDTTVHPDRACPRRLHVGTDFEPAPAPRPVERHPLEHGDSPCRRADRRGLTTFSVATTRSGTLTTQMRLAQRSRYPIDEGTPDGERRRVRAQPQRGVGDLARVAESPEHAEAIGNFLWIATAPLDRRPQHRGVDRTRTDGVDPDPVRRVVDRRVARHAEHAVLARGVRRLVGLRPERVRRRDVDDRSPAPCSSIWRISYFRQRKIDRRLTAMILSNISTSTSASRSRSSSMAAALTAQCRPPNASTVPEPAPQRARASATSVARNRAVPPAASIIRTVSLPPSSAMSATVTFAPARANAIAVARPMPPAAPVTKADLAGEILVARLVTPFLDRPSTAADYCSPPERIASCSSASTNTRCTRSPTRSPASPGATHSGTTATTCASAISTATCA